MRLEQRRALRIAAAVMFVIAYWYTKGILSSKNWERGSWQPLLVAAAFLALATWLAKCLQGGEQVPEKRSDRRETLLLGTCLFLQSLAFGLYPVHEDLIGIFQVLLWHGTAIFFVLSLAGMLADHRLGLLFPAPAPRHKRLSSCFLRGWRRLFWLFLRQRSCRLPLRPLRRSETGSASSLMAFPSGGLPRTFSRILSSLSRWEPISSAFLAGAFWRIQRS